MTTTTKKQFTLKKLDMGLVERILTDLNRRHGDLEESLIKMTEQYRTNGAEDQAFEEFVNEKLFKDHSISDHVSEQAQWTADYLRYEEGDMEEREQQGVDVTQDELDNLTMSEQTMLVICVMGAALEKGYLTDHHQIDLKNRKPTDPNNLPNGFTFDAD
ncbi:hypothetical protein N9Z27_00745 [Alphaproteobacteria bacterium]|nr:hypothetical protein [Alphaproteobacteria bacterium]